MIMYDVVTAPHFSAPGSADDEIGDTAALVSVTDIQGNTYDEITLPVFVYNPKDPNNPALWMTADSTFQAGRKLTSAEISNILAVYTTKIKAPPISTSYYDPLSFTNIQTVDPLLKAVFDAHPGRQEKFDKVTDNNGQSVENEDVTALDDPTIVVGTDISDFPPYK
jgi:hypothetical protein